MDWEKPLGFYQPLSSPLSIFHVNVMLNLAKNEISESKYQKLSFDFKLMFVYHIAMMVLFAVRPIKDSYHQLLFAILLIIILAIISFGYKINSKWKWPGLKKTTIPLFIFNIVFAFCFFSYVSYTINSIPIPDLKNPDIPLLLTEAWKMILQAASKPVFTPWFLAGFGIVLFSSLSSFNLVSTKVKNLNSKKGR